MEAIKDIKIEKGASAHGIIKMMGDSGGFTAKNLSLATDIVQKMTDDPNCLNFLSFTADIVATGTRGVIKDMVRDNMFDVIITTCGTLDHDIARCFKNYYEGTFDADDIELGKEGINRLGNVFVPNESYGMIIEDKMTEFLREILDETSEISTHELCWEIGRRLKDENSILYWAWKNKIPVIVPGPTDGSVGYQIWQYTQGKKFHLNLMKDEKLLSDLVWNAKRSGALMIGGGISKHHVIWWNQFKQGLDYVAYISTATEHDGSMSGARLKEAVSWGKIKPEAKSAFVYGDATVMLPFMYASLVDRR